MRELTRNSNFRNYNLKAKTARGEDHVTVDAQKHNDFCEIFVCRDHKDLKGWEGGNPFVSLTSASFSIFPSFL